jgi:hypothetical protein
MIQAARTQSCLKVATAHTAAQPCSFIDGFLILCQCDTLTISTKLLAIADWLPLELLL